MVNAAFASAGSWRWPLGLAFVPALVLLIGMYFLPETPRWLVSKDRAEEARRVLSQTRTEEQVDSELKDIRRAEEEEREQAGIRELLAPWVRPMLVWA